MEDELTSCNAN